MMMITQSLNGLLLLLRQADVGLKLYEMRERLQEDVTKLQVRLRPNQDVSNLRLLHSGNPQP